LGEIEHLRFIQMEEGLEVCCTVPVFCAVAKEILTSVRGSTYQPVLSVGIVVKKSHSDPGHQVPFKVRIFCIVLYLPVRLKYWLDMDTRKADPKFPAEIFYIPEILLPADPGGQVESLYPLLSQCPCAKGGSESGINSTTHPHDRP
jgi:hypothetical protein